LVLIVVCHARKHISNADAKRRNVILIRLFPFTYVFMRYFLLRFSQPSSPVRGHMVIFAALHGICSIPFTFPRLVFSWCAIHAWRSLPVRVPPALAAAAYRLIRLFIGSEQATPTLFSPCVAGPTLRAGVSTRIATDRCLRSPPKLGLAGRLKSQRGAATGN
jgi:hypothetical protein